MVSYINSVITFIQDSNKPMNNLINTIADLLLITTEEEIRKFYLNVLSDKVIRTQNKTYNNIEEYLEENKDILNRWTSGKVPDGTYIKILPYLKDIRNGFFVEAGAQSGDVYTSSNTKLLEDYNGWSGLLIEPADIYIESCKQNRQKSIVHNCALVSFDYKESTIDATLLNLMNDKTTRVCEARTFDSLADEYNISHVDLFSLDVEGYEMEVLKGINFEKVHISWFLIECNTTNYSYEELLLFMTNVGYELVANVSNFTKENSPQWPGTHQDYLFKHI